MRVDVVLDDIDLSAEAAAPPEVVDGGVLLRGERVWVASPVPVTRFYRHGWQSWSPTRWLDATRPVAPVTVPLLQTAGDDPAYALASRHGGSGLGAVDCGEDRVLLLGALGLGGRVEAAAGALEASSELDDAEWFAALGDEQVVFARYAALLGQRLGRRGGRVVRLWSTWASLGRDISEPLLGALVDEITSIPELDVDVLLVDDGWQRDVGDWQPNDAFPSGMAALAERISAGGFQPGLWLAPFLAGQWSPLAVDHPELLLLDDGGAPVVAARGWGGDAYALDVTAPGAVEAAAELVARAVGWGYRFLKLDFLYAAALPGRRHEDVHREVAYRRAVEALRAAAGDDTYLLGCGAPIIASLGVFDGLRVGPDVAPWWEHEAVTRHLHDLSLPATRHALTSALHRLWLSPLVDVDPDVVYLGPRGNALTARQRSWLLELARICGFCGTSELPGGFGSEERSAAATLFTPVSEVQRHDRYRFTVDGREVDFSAFAAAEPELL